MEKSSLKLLKVGYCKHCERIARKKGAFKNIKFPMIVGLIKDPQSGYVLFDTGYSKHFFECTQTFPDKLYAMTTPVTLDDNEKIEHLLEKENIKLTDIHYVVISHFHADHISGLKLFPNATFICSKDAIDDFQSKEGFFAVKKGYLKRLLPEKFESRLLLKESLPKEKTAKKIFPFNDAYALSTNIKIIDLNGHAKGQIGLLINNEYFLVADACWSDLAYKNIDLPSKITNFIFDDKNEYINNIKKLNTLYKNNKDIEIIPSHCENTYNRLNEKLNEEFIDRNERINYIQKNKQLNLNRIKKDK